jgi:hypothetical protein
MTREEAQELIKKHGSMRKASKAAGIHRDTLSKIAAGIKVRLGPGRPPNTLGISTKPYIGLQVQARSVTDFRNTYDLNTIVPKKIAAGFKQLGAGWLYESEFAKAAGLTMKDLGNFRDNYAEHIVVVKEGRRVWAGKKTVAEQMRQMI